MCTLGIRYTLYSISGQGPGRQGASLDLVGYHTLHMVYHFTLHGPSKVSWIFSCQGVHSCLPVNVC